MVVSWPEFMTGFRGVFGERAEWVVGDGQFLNANQVRLLIEIGLVVEVDLPFINQGVRIVDGVLIPFSLLTIGDDDLVMGRPGAVRRVCPRDRYWAVIAPLTAGFHEPLIVEIVFSFPFQNVGGRNRAPAYGWLRWAGNGDPLLFPGKPVGTGGIPDVGQVPIGRRDGVI
jgi:hypothetical protein